MAEHKTCRDAIQGISGAPNAKTQCARILRLLIAARGAWVPLPAIIACAAQYNARLWTLRHRMGFNIENRTEYVDGVRHSWFRLVNSTAPAPKPEPAKPQPLKSWEQVCAERDEKMRQSGRSFELVP